MDKVIQAGDSNDQIFEFYMLRVFLLSLLLITIQLRGQKLTFSQVVVNSTDKEVVSIQEFWKAYIKDMSQSNIKTQSDIFAKYWNKEELDLGFTDIINDELPVYSLGEIIILSIDKQKNGFYNIKNKVVDNAPIGTDTSLAVFNVYVKKGPSGYKLYNYFHLSKSNLLHSKIGDIDYYYPENFVFNPSQAAETDYFYTRISGIYANYQKKILTYIVATSFNEANRLIGYDQSIVTSSSPYAGFSIKNQRVILSTRVDHFHEIIHAVFFNKFPNSPALFNEGVATYYGGTGGFSYSKLIGQFKEFVKENPKTNLSDFDDLNLLLENGTNNFYILGAILVDYAIKNGGSQKVIDLFDYSLKSQLISDDPWPAIENVIGIKKDQFDSSIRKYLKSL
jgi:hypothetical protein